MAKDDTIPNLADLEVLELIGEGGMGSVYRGYQPLLDRHVAVKFLNTARSKNPTEMMERFRREARILASLGHPNIVGCYHAGVADEDGKIYLVMELVKGPDFAEYINDNGPLSINLALKITRDIADALRFALANNIIHRDIKPANILLQTPDGNPSNTGMPYTPKLADLGLAKYQVLQDDQTELTQVGTVMGSPIYMAPEQIENPDNVDFRVDMYALGCVLFQALTGEKPFAQPRITDVINKKLSTQAPDPRPFRQDFPEDIAKLVQKMMAKDRNERFASYDELIAEIDQLMAGPATTKKTGIPKVLIAVGAGVLLVALFVVGMLSSLGDSTEKPEALEKEAAPKETVVAEQTLSSPTPQPTVESITEAPTLANKAPLATISSQVWSGNAVSLFQSDWGTRLEGWNKPSNGSYGSSEEDETGIVGTGENGSISYAPKGPLPWLVEGKIDGVSATEYGVFVETQSFHSYQLLVQELGEDVLVGVNHVDSADGVKRLGTPFTVQAPEGITFKLGVWENHLEFSVNGSEAIEQIPIDSKPVGFGIFQKKDAISAQNFTLQYGE